MTSYGLRGFDAEDLLEKLFALDLSQFVGCVVGSGFEAQPELLQKIAESIPLIGNAADAVAAVKNASSFFGQLKQLNIPHPAVFTALPDAAINAGAVVYLRKLAGGSGGTHIRLGCASKPEMLDNEYYQQLLDGQPVSLLFLADGREIVVVGFNEQWLSPSENMPFRYGGAVSRIVLSSSVQQQLIDAAEKLTKLFGLMGLNSLDAIAQSDMAYVLEVNPRLSATVDLYEALQENLLHRHVQVCLGGGLGQVLQVDAAHQTTESIESKAHGIVYATVDTEIAPSFKWPDGWSDWVVDMPDHVRQIIKIPAGAPICSVIAYAESAQTAKQLVHARVELVQNLFKCSIAKQSLY